MSRDNLTFPVAAATPKVKLRPYNEEEPHIWFRLIVAQFAAAGIKSQKLTYANLPKQVLQGILAELGILRWRAQVRKLFFVAPQRKLRFSKAQLRSLRLKILDATSITTPCTLLKHSERTTAEF